MGIGFTFALLIIGSIREILGSGTWFGLPITVNLFSPISIFVLAPGGFLVFGCVDRLCSTSSPTARLLRERALAVSPVQMRLAAQMPEREAVNNGIV